MHGTPDKLAAILPPVSFQNHAKATGEDSDVLNPSNLGTITPNLEHRLEACTPSPTYRRA